MALPERRPGGVLQLFCAVLLLVAMPVARHAAVANGWEHAAIPFEVLVRALDSPDGATRIRAAESLGLRGQREAVTPLIRALRREEPNHNVRGAIYGALGRLGDQRGEAALSGCLDAEYREEIRATCAIGLGGLGTRAAVTTLAALLREDEAPQVRSAALAALGMLGGEEAVVILIRHAETAGDATTRLQALAALAETGSARAARPLLAALATAQDDTTLAVLVDALGRVGASQAAQPLAGLLARTDDPALRARIAIALGKIRQGSSVPVLVGLLDDESPRSRYFAVRALEKLGDRSAVPALLRIARRIETSLTARTPEELLARPQHTADEVQIEIAALRAVIALDPRRGASELTAAAAPIEIPPDSAAALRVAEAVFDRRRTALHGLGYTAAAEAGKLLAGETGIGDRDPRLRATAARSLGVLGPPEVEATVRPLLRDPAAEVRWTAARVLGLVDAKGSITDLIAALNDANGHVRAEAARALGHLGAGQAVGRLEVMAATDRSAPARKGAAYALHLLTGP